MSIRLFLFVPAAALLLVCACTSMRPNPEYRSCVNTCNEHKKKCMLAAFSTDAIEKCDSEMNACMNRCSAFPAMIPAEK